MAILATSSNLDDLRRILAGAQLPGLPQSAIRLLDLSKDPENGPVEFAAVIEADPGLTGQVLRFVNSSYFGFSREISSVKLAITMVGVRTIKNFSLWNAVFSLMPNPKCGAFDLKKLWQDSLRRGLFARSVAKLLGLKAEDAFSAALLQDMAVPMLAKELPEAYSELLVERNQGRRRLSDLERDRFGWTHAEAAGLLALKWNLPSQFAALLEQHAGPMARGHADPLGGVVALSAMLPAAADSDWPQCDSFEQAYAGLSCKVGLPTVGELLETIDGEYAQFAPVLKISRSSKSLGDYHRQAAGSAG